MPIGVSTLCFGSGHSTEREAKRPEVDMETGRARCKGVRKNGEPCANYPIKGSDYCHWHRPSLKEHPAETVSRQELLALLAKYWKVGAAFLTGTLADQIVGDLWTYLKKRFRMEFLVPPVRMEQAGGKSKVSAGFRITNPSHSPATVLLSFYPRHADGTYDFTYTIPARDGIVVHLDRLAGLPDGKFSAIISSDQAVRVVYILPLALTPEVFDPRTSEDIRWQIGFPDHMEFGARPASVTVTLVAGAGNLADAGLNVPTKLAGNFIVVDRSFILDYLDDHRSASGAFLIQMNGHLVFSTEVHERAAAVTPGYPTSAPPPSLGFETTLSVIQVSTVPHLVP